MTDDSSKLDSAIEMFVGGLMLDPSSQAPVIILKDETGQIQLPIWIGIPEATSIASAIKQINMTRPLTHDLMVNVFGEVGVSVERVVITDLKDSTYFAELILAIGDKAMILDSRPSDAIALALRTDAPIFVAQRVLDNARTAFSGQAGQAGGQQGQPPEQASGETGEESQEEPVLKSEADFKSIDKEKWKEILSDLDPDDFKYKM